MNRMASWVKCIATVQPPLTVCYLLADLLQDGRLQLHVLKQRPHDHTLLARLQITQLPDGHRVS